MAHDTVDIADLATDRDVLEVNLGGSPFTVSVAEAAKTLCVVEGNEDFCRIASSGAKVRFVLGNPLFSIPKGTAYDVIISNIDLRWFEKDDIVDFLRRLQTVTKATTSIYLRADYGPEIETLHGLSSSMDIENAWAESSDNKPSERCKVEGVYLQTDSISQGEDRAYYKITCSPSARNDAQVEDGEDNPVWEDEKLPLAWRDAMYTGKSQVMSDLFQRQMDLVKTEIAALGHNVSYVEVGCGTSEMGALLQPSVSYYVGVELSPTFITLSKRLHPSLHEKNVRLIQANAIRLNEVLKSEMDRGFWQTRRVVCILMNTLGILPEAIREKVLSEMLSVAGDDGLVIVGCWHKDSLGVGVEKFYKQSPELCGKVTDEMVDLAAGDLFVPSTGYRSHWWSVDEMKSYFVNMEGHGVDFELESFTAGIGVFLAARPLNQKKEKQKEMVSERKSDNPVWEDAALPVAWREAMYSGKCQIMSHLFEQQIGMVKSLIRSSDVSVSYVEVGCGTSEMGAILQKDVGFYAGVELSETFIQLSKVLHKSLHAENVNLVQGNAVKLNKLLEENMPACFWKTRRIVCMLMNTLGILPDEIRESVIGEMVKLAGADGVVILGCWHKDSLAVGVEEFYKKSPKLCGVVTDDMVDLSNGNLRVPSTGYTSHWWSADEMTALFRPFEGTVNLEVFTKGVGIFLVAKARQVV